ncbi:MAG: biotin--[acetyl-CoA-carboxylase] ligase [Balneolaceae bacterium]|nr:biotin--[acetyl-CoA-carboxylase] ligase [Balneolaceae bacterium]
MFDVNTFKNALTTRWLGHEVLYFKELDSTNSYMKKLPGDKIDHGLLCLADSQTEGRGQYNKSWDAAPGKNLTFTLAFKPGESSRFHIVTLVCAKAIIDEIKNRYGLKPYIKWPNDIIVEEKKIAGLLTESTFCGNKVDRLLVGIGLNVNQEEFPSRLKDIAASLKLLTGQMISREELLASLLSRMEYGYGRWHKRDSSLLKEINKNIEGYGRWVTLSINGVEREEPGKLLGINEKGQMTIINPEGEIETFSYEQIRIITD